jgi:hypothetical protein
VLGAVFVREAEKDGTGEGAALRRAWASRKAATEMRCWEEELLVEEPSRGRGRAGGRWSNEEEVRALVLLAAVAAAVKVLGLELLLELTGDVDEVADVT